MSSTTKHRGGCLCGAVRFEVEGDFEQFFFCHCSHCRKDTGSAHAANLFSSTAKLAWLSGEAQVTSYDLPSTRHTRSFCSTCGSALPKRILGGNVVVVPAGSLETPVTTKPTAHIFLASRADWDHDLEHVTKLDGLPG